MTPTAADRRQRLIGIALMCGAVALFACLDATAKWLSGQMDVLQIVWARYTSAFVLALTLSNPISRPGLVRTSRPWLQIVRSALLLGSTAFNFVALRHLQLDQTLSIAFSTPFLVATVSGPLLGEWIGPRRWIAILVGFAGVLVVTRPGFGGIHPAALWSVASALCYAFYIVSTRVLSRTDSNETTLFYSNIVGMLALTPVVPLVWTTPDGPMTIALMVLIGAFGTIGHYLLIAAHRKAPAAILSPFIYTQIVSMVTLGYLVFGDLPSRWTLAGAAIVIASGLYLLYRERVRKGGVEPIA